MGNRVKGKKPPPYFYTGPPLDKETKAQQTDDVYDNDVREAMLDNDEMTAAEAGFLRGHEQEPPGKKETLKNAISLTDEIATELAKEEAEDD
jgi:hypothetical protein